ncbi:Tripartite-type tricarboxylate transporter, receptor component TctC [Paenibacillus sophorae]|uniref:Tripartite tricarboxylate transporter substrate binding protein n=1 Tax=Paenibacillus sophorae TaxID=1333845 RepID=A0A1H8Q4V6_9BACL|nr:tripartite tricarboxylate transporter substrate binding protein [Paenibacillus sophorae]QWU15272.1 tripartite tricarboxylate transporter substrate binding protein [Paenibacillus sophorae]SEO49096.1 Tripartite-type tricarboxylate transporter, receptor component TctC [Paenibacillus sophorae]
MTTLNKKLSRLLPLSLALLFLISGCGTNSAKSGAGASAGAGGETAVPAASQAASASSAYADYPNRPIEYVVPFSAGGGVDLVARTVVEGLSKEWGQPIEIVNKPGAGGATGAQYALKQAANDGYTVLADNVASTTMLQAGSAAAPLLLSDHEFAARVVTDAPVFVVAADAPWKDFREFSDWAKANPEKLTWTSVGPAGFSTFAVAEWLKAIGADFSKTRMVATKGASESLPLVAGGNAVLAVHTVNETSTLVKAGKLKVLAILAPERSPYYPDVPTTAEQGVEGLSVSWWTGMSFPKGTPQEIVKKWEDGVSKLSQDPDFIEKLKKLQLDPNVLTGQEFTDFVNKEAEYYTGLATQTGIRK